MKRWPRQGSDQHAFLFWNDHAGIAALLSVIVAQPLTKPILDLTRITDEVQKEIFPPALQSKPVTRSVPWLKTFNGMTAQLQDTLASLEERVHERTAALEASSRQVQRRSSQLETIADVAQTIASIQDLNILLPEITRLVSERFGHYHAGVFLLDEKGEYAVLRAANSEGGQKMLARRHKLRVGREGVVGFSIPKDMPTSPSTWVRMRSSSRTPTCQHPLGISLPLIIGDRVIGALDVQSEHTGAFTSEDSEVLTTLANQVAVAIENTRLFAESRQALAELDKTFRRYIEGEWQDLSTLTDLGGYLANDDGLTPIVRSHKRTGKSKASTYKCRSGCAVSRSERSTSKPTKSPRNTRRMKSPLPRPPRNVLAWPWKMPA